MTTSAALELHRRPNGQFGEQPRPDAGQLDLTTDTSSAWTSWEQARDHCTDLSHAQLRAQVRDEHPDAKTLIVEWLDDPEAPNWMYASEVVLADGSTVDCDSQQLVQVMSDLTSWHGLLKFETDEDYVNTVDLDSLPVGRPSDEELAAAYTELHLRLEAAQQASWEALRRAVKDRFGTEKLFVDNAWDENYPCMLWVKALAPDDEINQALEKVSNLDDVLDVHKDKQGRQWIDLSPALLRPVPTPV